MKPITDIREILEDEVKQEIRWRNAWAFQQELNKRYQLERWKYRWLKAKVVLAHVSKLVVAIVGMALIFVTLWVLFGQWNP
jgi:hypothetical protein